MTSLADRFRRWYDYERDCNAKTLAMLASVPTERRAEAGYRKALDKMAHLVSARRRWLHRLGHWPEVPGLFPEGVALDSLSVQVADTEKGWVAYLSRLDDADLAHEFEYVAGDGKKYRWDVEGVLTQKLSEYPSPTPPRNGEGLEKPGFSPLPVSGRGRGRGSRTASQVFGHAWYHRGQIASLVASLGGKAVDTDYVFWCKLTPME